MASSSQQGVGENEPLEGVRRASSRKMEHAQWVETESGLQPTAGVEEDSGPGPRPQRGGKGKTGPVDQRVRQKAVNSVFVIRTRISVPFVRIS